MVYSIQYHEIYILPMYDKNICWLFGYLKLLAGAEVNDLTPQKQTALHIAAIHDHSTLCSILLENGIDFDAVDNNQNNGMLSLWFSVVVLQYHHATCIIVLFSSVYF